MPSFRYSERGAAEAQGVDGLNRIDMLDTFGHRESLIAIWVVS
jgi:hypothetical protein